MGGIRRLLRAPRAALPWWAPFAAIFLASLLVVHVWSGSSPALWLDTLNDQREVRACVDGDSCSMLGQSASVQGLFVAGGWLEVRSLLYVLGIGLDGVHFGIQVLDALGVALVALAGFRLGGRLLGSTAALLLMVGLGRTAATREAIYNTSPLLFFGAVLLLACLAAASRPGLRPAVVIALLAAAMADCHACCAPMGATVVGVALLAPGRRIVRASAAAATFAAAAFAMAPLAWIANVRFALHGGGGSGHARAPASLAAVSVLWTDQIALFAMIGLVAWVVAAVRRDARTRRRLDVVALTAAPMVLVLVAAVSHGVGDSGGKYLAHVKPAAALGAAVPLVALARAIAARSPGLGRFLLPARQPWIAAAVIALLAVPGATIASDSKHFPHFTVRDARAVVTALRNERGWSRARLVRHLQAVDLTPILTGLLDEEMGSWPPSSDDDDDPTDAFLLQLRPAELPDPPPEGWAVVRRTSSSATVLVFTRSRLDRRGLEMCAGEGEARGCVHEADFDPANPQGDRLPDQGTLKLRVPLLPGPEAVVFMPRIHDFCGGRVVSVPAAARIEQDGRLATLDAAAPGDPVALEIAWAPRSPECPNYFGRPRPPFFVAADAATATALAAMLRSHEP